MGAPVTITCDCGAAERVEYGGRWTCEACGRTWNTAQIPREEYEGLLRAVRRFRLQVVAFLAVMAAVFIPLALFVNDGFLFVAFIVSFAWITLYMPRLRRKVRRVAAEAPEWRLRPE
jgi:hypothetical protein